MVRFHRHIQYIAILELHGSIVIQSGDQPLSCHKIPGWGLSCWRSLFFLEKDREPHSPPAGDTQVDNQPVSQPDSQPNVLQGTYQGTSLDSQPLDINSVNISVPSRQNSRPIAIEEQVNSPYQGAQKKKKLTWVSFKDTAEVELTKW